MKIAYIVGIFPTPFFINNQIIGLLKKKHKIDIYAFESFSMDITDSDIIKYSLRDNLTYFHIPKNKILKLIKAFYLFLINFIKYPRILLKSLNFLRFGKEALKLNTIYYVIPFLNSNYDIIHCHFGPNGLVGSILKNIGIKGKLVTTFYGYDLTSYLYLKGNDVYQSLFNNGDLFLPICNYFKDILDKTGCNAKKIKVNHINVDCNKYKYIKRRRTEIFEILTVAEFVEKKGYKYSLKTIEKLKNKYSNIRYTIAGDGPLKKEIFKLINELNLQKYVNCVGRVNQKQLIELYKKAHVFILPSVISSDNNQEGTPTVLLEAQASGLPVITTKHSGIPEIVIDGKTGFVVFEKDVETLTEKIMYYIENPKMINIMGRFGRLFVEENFEMNKSNKILEETYKLLLKKNKI